ncbi:MAG TPA: hypothetical protein PLE78_12160 [Flavobacteriales bacterium]|nr:hypothetical protein [Flavobacteriales bacterium]HQV76238.1 hypothetical protein [Flavobacteriales bacterium]
MRIRDPRDLGLWWVAAAMFAYISVRAFLVPVVHDEARVMRLYVYSGHLLPPLAKLDAGNHLLVTLLGQWTTFLFGYKLWAVRLFPVLTYPLYAFGVIGLMRMIDARIIRWCFGIALLTMPFLFEFFSLFRGYGPSIAFEVLGLLTLIRYMEKGETSSLALTLLFFSLAIFSNLSLMLVCCAAFGLATIRLVIYQEHDRAKQFVLWLLGGVAVGSMVWYGTLLSEGDLLYWGGTTGLLNDVIGPLVFFTSGATSSVWNGAVALLVCIALAWAAGYFLWKKQDPARFALVVVAMVLLVEVVGRALMAWTMDTPWPTQRTALHYLPLALALFAFALDRLATMRPWAKWASLVVVCFPIQTLVTLNTTESTTWVDQCIAPKVFDLVAAAQAKTARPVLINAPKFIGEEAWNLGRLLRGEVPAPLDFEQHPITLCDLLITDPNYTPAPNGFHRIYEAPNGRLVLWTRDTPLNERLLLDTTFSVQVTDREFMDFWRINASDTIIGQPFFVEVDMVVEATNFFTASVITDSRPAEGDPTYWDRVELTSLRPTWANENLHLIRRVPADQSVALNSVVSLYNPDRVEYSLPKVHVRVYAVNE